MASRAALGAVQLLDERGVELRARPGRRSRARRRPRRPAGRRAGRPPRPRARAGRPPAPPSRRSRSELLEEQRVAAGCAASSPLGRHRRGRPTQRRSRPRRRAEPARASRSRAGGRAGGRRASRRSGCRGGRPPCRGRCRAPAAATASSMRPRWRSSSSVGRSAQWRSSSTSRVGRAGGARLAARPARPRTRGSGRCPASCVGRRAASGGVDRGQHAGQVGAVRGRSPRRAPAAGSAARWRSSASTNGWCGTSVSSSQRP